MVTYDEKNANAKMRNAGVEDRSMSDFKSWCATVKRSVLLIQVSRSDWCMEQKQGKACKQAKQRSNTRSGKISRVLHHVLHKFTAQEQTITKVNKPHIIGKVF